MCWSTYVNENKRERTAKEDMLVYKIVNKYRGFGYVSYYMGMESTLWRSMRPLGFSYVSYYMGMEYIPDKEYSINNLMAINCSDGETIIKEGYHSYSAQECDICINHVFNTIDVYNKSKFLKEGYYETRLSVSVPNNESTAVVACVIPKGSIYYKNEHGEIVSDHLIIKNEIEKESLA